MEERKAFSLGTTSQHPDTSAAARGCFDCGTVAAEKGRDTSLDILSPNTDAQALALSSDTVAAELHEEAVLPEEEPAASLPLSGLAGESLSTSSEPAAGAPQPASPTRTVSRDKQLTEELETAFSVRDSCCLLPPCAIATQYAVPPLL